MARPAILLLPLLLVVVAIACGCSVVAFSSVGSGDSGGAVGRSGTVGQLVLNEPTSVQVEANVPQVLTVLVTGVPPEELLHSGLVVQVDPVETQLEWGMNLGLGNGSTMLWIGCSANCNACPTYETPSIVSLSYPFTEPLMPWNDQFIVNMTLVAQPGLVGVVSVTATLQDWQTLEAPIGSAAQFPITYAEGLLSDGDTVFAAEGVFFVDVPAQAEYSCAAVNLTAPTRYGTVLFSSNTSTSTLNGNGYSVVPFNNGNTASALIYLACSPDVDINAGPWVFALNTVPLRPVSMPVEWFMAELIPGQDWQSTHTLAASANDVPLLSVVVETYLIDLSSASSATVKLSAPQLAPHAVCSMTFQLDSTSAPVLPGNSVQCDCGPTCFAALQINAESHRVYLNVYANGESLAYGGNPWGTLQVEMQ